MTFHTCTDEKYGCLTFKEKDTVIVALFGVKSDTSELHLQVFNDIFALKNVECRIMQVGVTLDGDQMLKPSGTCVIESCQWSC